jgi:biotin synthase-like enzyme
LSPCSRKYVGRRRHQRGRAAIAPSPTKNRPGGRHAILGVMEMLTELTEKALRREPLTRDEALAVLATPDDEVMEVVAAGYRVRRRYFGNRVKVNFLVNLKSGLCPEDCTYCSQRVGSAAEVLKYSWLKPAAAVAAASAGIERGATAWWAAGGARRTGTSSASRKRSPSSSRTTRMSKCALASAS